MGNLLEGPSVNNAQTNRANRQLAKAKRNAKSLQPVDIRGGGLRSTFKDNSVSLSSSPERQGLVGSISEQFLQQAGLTAGLRAKVAPGFSDLRTARLQQIENARSAAISNLRENLARRRVLGSSFGADAETRANLEFSQQRDKVEAETFLQELDLTHQLIGQEFDQRRSAFNTKLGELNIQADLATKLSAQATDVLKASAQLQSQIAISDASTNAQLGIAQTGLDAQAQQGAGQLIGQVGGTVLGAAVGGPIGASIGSSVGNSLGRLVV